MAWTFGDFQLDPERFQLNCCGRRVPLEPQVLSLLIHLVENRERMVTKEQIAAAVWGEDAVSDASISSRIRSVRRAVGDNGAQQGIIRTVHGRGFRFVAEAIDVAKTPSSPDPSAQQPPIHPCGRPSIAVLPFQAVGVSPDLAILAEAIPHEIIRALSRLRWLAVIARGSSFRFRQATTDLDLVATTLGARYVLTGIVESRGLAIAVTLELTDTDSCEILWADQLEASPEGIEEMRAQIVAHLLVALEIHVPLNEARIAQLKDPESLDAWANYHVGLHHLYRFTATDTALAQLSFKRAVAADSHFARAHAGLSFTSFLDAFLHLRHDTVSAALEARRHAEDSVALDPLDPFANFTMGRSFWLTDEPERAAEWLARATTLNPNYAQGFYATAFTAMLIGHAPDTVAALDASLRLSPLDPLLFGIYGVRAQVLIQQNDYGAAAQWADRAATTPGAHYLIAMTALVANGLAGRHGQALRWRREIHRLKPDATMKHYFAAFPTRDAASRKRIAVELRRHGL